ncbi:divalent metal cation transporter [Verrucomicrobia bacterium]|nr:divalent metal cation transporter [Verrucomicrobiota bacterium]MDC0219379.1 divalent metal cation transporter [Verrucomicrobiota bacterium]
MSEENDSLTQEKELLTSVENASTSEKIKTYTKLSGPGWLQGAITLGGGSLAGSLYLGVIGGTQLLWLQPLMMIFGVLMLSVIGYVSLSTGKSPFQAINQHINPVLGWGWLIAAMLANLVWAMPQFSLGTAALQQNLGILTDDPETKSQSGKYLCAAILFIIATVVVWMYDSKGVKYFEIILKILVGIIVLSFFGVVIVMAGQLEWGAIAKGFIPDFSMLSQPADIFKEKITKSMGQQYWTDTILSIQRDKMVTAAATAVGINMTFLLPYSMLRKGWGKEHRGLASFDLGMGLFIPFFLATTCVVIASASQFHGKYDEGLLDANKPKPTEKIQKAYEKNLAGIKAHLGVLESENDWDRQLAAMLVKRDANQFALSLGKLTGDKNASQSGKKSASQIIFGIGVLGMALSTIIILMLINGFCLTEALGAKMGGVVHLTGALLPGITGALGFLFLWSNAQANFLLTVPTSIFGMVLLPIAYFTFFCMINSKELMGDALPKGGKRVALNLAMGLALVAASIGASWSIWSKAQWVGVGVVGAFILLVWFGHGYRKLNQKLDRIEDKLER